MKKQNWDIYIGVFLISFAVIGMEMVINRLFAVRFWYHFAFMIVSIALFGIGIGSMLVFFVNKFLKKHPDIVLAVLSTAIGVFITYTLVAGNANPLEIEKIGKVAIQSTYFTQYFLLLSIPFVLAGFIFSFLFTNYRDDINNVYFFDLVGGGIGALFALLIFPDNGPFKTAFVFSAITMALPAIFLFKRIKWLSVIPSALLLTFAFVWLLPQTQDITLKITRDKRYTYPLKKEAVFSGWDNFGYTAVHEKDGQKDSLVSTANYSSYANLIDTSTPAKYKAFKTNDIMKEFSHPFVVKKNPEDVGIVGVGAGKDVLISLLNGAKNVYGAEFNPTMFKVNRIFSNYTGGIINRTNVHLKMAEGRFFIKSSPRKYDILLFDNAIAIAAVQSGAFTLAEGYLYTVEAVMDYVEKLKPNGILYLSNPFPDYQRFITICREAFKRMGKEASFRDSIWVGDNQSKVYRRCKVMIKNGKYTAKECDALAKYCKKSGHAVMYSPNRAGERTTEEVEDDKSSVGTRSAGYARHLITTKDITKAYANATAEIRPSTDDWPFYSQTVKLDKKSYDWAKANPSRMYSEPFIMLTGIIKQAVILSLLFLLIPLLLFNMKGFTELDNKFGSIIYFASLGLGFMFIEIVLMQKYQLILGHPIYAFAVVLSTIMISTGVGSFFSERFKSPYNAIHIGLLGIIVTTALAWLFTRFVGHTIIDWPFIIRVVIVGLLVAFSGFFMGFMMPSGIRAISASENAIPWLWSVNAIFSTVAGFVSILISILYGFTWVLVAGMAIYIIGWLFFQFKVVPVKS